MEWRVMFRRGVGERRTALVQLSDERLIVLVQVSSMTSAPFYFILATLPLLIQISQSSRRKSKCVRVESVVPVAHYTMQEVIESPEVIKLGANIHSECAF